MRWAEMSNLTIVKVCTATAVWCIAWVAMGFMSLHLFLIATGLEQATAVALLQVQPGTNPEQAEIDFQYNMRQLYELATGERITNPANRVRILLAACANRHCSSLPFQQRDSQRTSRCSVPRRSSRRLRCLSWRRASGARSAAARIGTGTSCRRWNPAQHSLTHSVLFRKSVFRYQTFA